MVSIRNTTFDDMDDILKIYAHAREEMKKNNNPHQWKDDKPYRQDIGNDINDQNSYVILDDDEIVGVFSFIIGPDKTYGYIDGEWLNEDEYGTIHRIASKGKIHGIFSIALDFCKEKNPNIRIDTHEDNKIMQHLLEKNGFKRCGIIYLENGEPRIGFQR